jgi:hypothetical protein
LIHIFPVFLLFSKKHYICIVLSGKSASVFIDVADASGVSWRLPNIAELGQMHTSGAATAAWSPKYNALTSWPNAATGTINLKTNYWSITEYSSARTIFSF